MSIVTVVVGADCPVTAFATRKPELPASASAAPSSRNGLSDRIIVPRDLDPFVEGAVELHKPLVAVGFRAAAGAADVPGGGQHARDPAEERSDRGERVG